METSEYGWCFTFSNRQGVLANHFVLVKFNSGKMAMEEMTRAFGFQWELQLTWSQVQDINDKYPAARMKCYAIIEKDGRIWYP